MIPSARQNLLRASRAPVHDHGSVTFVELFFDLVFVFAITQLSHGLLEDLSLVGLMHTGLLLLAVWWAWIDTSWVTNWLDPQRTPVRLLLFVLMLTGLILSSSIPQAFGDRGLVFACAYAFMQLGRTCFMLWALRGHSPGNFCNFQRIACWHAVVAALWIAGGIASAEARLALWVLALFVETIAPTVGFFVPRLGRSTTADWTVHGGHIAERCGLFIIIALGESILVTGATFAGLEWTSEAVAAFLAAFVGAVAMWWIYFNIGAERARHHMEHVGQTGAMARLAYTYIHILIVAGIIVVAVADELVLTHPAGHVDSMTLAAVVGGPALYLIANLLFKRTVADRLPLSHLVGLVLLALLAPVSGSLSPLLLGVGASGVLVIVAIWETVSLRSWRATADRAP